MLIEPENSYLILSYLARKFLSYSNSVPFRRRGYVVTRSRDGDLREARRGVRGIFPIPLSRFPARSSHTRPRTSSGPFWPSIVEALNKR